ncbi:MAG: acyl-CoA synthetase [Rhodothermales bacterium]|nr:acyl-CoA synthetase [Rhodothermales bacterium]
MKLFHRASTHGDRIAFRTPDADRTYDELVIAAEEIAAMLLNGDADLAEARIAFLAPAGFDYAAAQWGIWRAGGVAVPLSLSATPPELAYTLSDSGASVLLASASHAASLVSVAAAAGIPLLTIESAAGTVRRALPALGPERRALMLYTSGTTNKPKGVLTTHANVEAQITTLIEAWRWRADDRIPLFLPLHHIHGIINVQSCALWAGALIEPFPKFDLSTLLPRVAVGAYTVFMAVPTIYVKLIEHLDALSETERGPVVAGFGRMRLMVSGSAALPASVHEAWTRLTGQKLLERYGMTEIGMGLSNPYEGERRPGMVGQPLPGVEVRLKAENGAIITTEGEPGEILVRGPSVFQSYWNRPEATAESFEEGWFRTGDMAVVEDGYYRIMGRLSVDIIKSGGYKLSALEIEAVLLEHPSIRECAVVGIPDATWGEAVSAAVVLAPGELLTLEDLRAWCGDRLSSYKRPSRLLVVGDLPRNAMGKVTKPAVVALFR